MVPKYSDAVVVHCQNATIWSHRDFAHKESGSQLTCDCS